MTPREPDRFEAKGEELAVASGTARCPNRVALSSAIAAALRAEHDDALERAAQLALNPYGEEVQCYGGDEPFAVGKKIAKAIRAMKSPAAAPAAESSNQEARETLLRIASYVGREAQERLLAEALAAAEERGRRRGVEEARSLVGFVRHLQALVADGYLEGALNAIRALREKDFPALAPRDSGKDP